jgi:hypothetical protein
MKEVIGMQINTIQDEGNSPGLWINIQMIACH